jgi:hypothetical protein
MVDPVGRVGAVQDTLIFPGSDRGAFRQGRMLLQRKEQGHSYTLFVVSYYSCLFQLQFLFLPPLSLGMSYQVVDH